MSDVIIGDILPYTQATAIASQTVFGTNWTANYASDVVVYYTPSGMPPDDASQKLASNQFSVAFIGALQQVQVTLVTPANAGDIITITRMTPADRENIYTNTNFTPSMLNNDFEILTLVDQQAQLVNQLIAPRYNYSAVIAPNASFPNANIILPILLPNQVWVMNSTGTAIEGFEIQTESTGTVLPGLANELAFYAEDGNVVSGLTYTSNSNYVLTSVAGNPPTWQPASAIGTVITIDADSGSATPTLGIIHLSGGTTGLTTVASTNVVDLTGTLDIANGGTSVTSVTTTPTASAWAGWDANKNLFANNFVPDYATTITAAGTTTLTNQSAYNQFFTGSTTQNLVLPVVSTLALGFPFYVINNSSGNVTIKSSGGNTVQVMAPGTSAYLTCILTTGTTAASWNCEYAFNGGEGSGTVNTGTINDLAYYAATGTAVSALSTANNSGLLTNGSGVPAWVTVTGTGAPVLGTSPIISSPLINNIFDPVNNLQVFAFQGVASAVNYIAVANNGTAGHPSLRFIGSDTDVNGDIVAQGAGSINIYNNNGASKTLIFQMAGVSSSAVNYVGLANATTGNSPGFSAAGSDTNVILSLRGQGTGGTQAEGAKTNRNAGAGFVGEFVSNVISAGSPVTFTSSSPKDLTSINLTAGNWMTFANITFSGTTITAGEVWISTSSASTPDLSLLNYTAPVATSTAIGLSAPFRRFSLATTTTVYVSGTVTGTGTITGCGGIYAVRTF